MTDHDGQTIDVGPVEVGGLPYPAGRLIEQPDPRLPQRPVPPATIYEHAARQHEQEQRLALPAAGPDVDPAAQALVWSLTASTHAAEALTALTRRYELLERGGGSEEDAAELEFVTRLHAYHDDAHKIADKCAGTWALVASVQPFEGVMVSEDLDTLLESDESGSTGKSGTDA